MIISGESFVMEFVAQQARILYAAERREVPAYVALMGDTSGLVGITAETSSLFGIANRDLEAALNGNHFVPDAPELGSERLAAYETAQKFSHVIIAAIEAVIQYGGESNERREAEASTMLSSLVQMSLTFRLAEGMYNLRSFTRSTDYFPLDGVRTLAFDHHDFALERVLRGALASRRGEFEGALAISTSVRTRDKAISR